MAFYRGREVQVIRDARQGDPGWGSNDGSEQVVVLYKHNGEQETVRKGEITESIVDSGKLAEMQANPQPGQKRPKTLADAKIEQKKK